MRFVLSGLCALALAAASAAAPAVAAGRGHDQFAVLPPVKADHVVVLKGQRELMLMRGEDVLRTYRIALGRYPHGQKMREGDARTPEGSYMLDFKLDDSNFYKAIHISYPNAMDLARAEMLGVNPGGEIMIHGLPKHMSARRVGHPDIDWTQGCIAVTDREMDEIYRLVDEGTPIEIRP